MMEVLELIMFLIQIRLRYITSSLELFFKHLVMSCLRYSFCES